MTDNPQADIREAARLTRAGRLAEATTLLQRKLAGLLRSNAGAANPASGNPAGAGGEDAPRRFVPEALRRAFGRAAPGVSGWAPPSRPSPDLVPDGGQFLARSFANPAGRRDYRLYVPSGYRGQALPLIVMLHGCKQSPEDFAAGTRMNARAEERTCFVAYPAQASSANSAKCWNWFDPRHQQRGQGEASLIAGITGQIMDDFAVDPDRIYVAGLSAGGAAAAIMAATYPDLYVAAGVHSGVAYAAARDLSSAFAVMRQGEAAGWPGFGPGAPPARMPYPIVPTIAFHGDRDATVHPRNAERMLAQLAAGLELEQRVEHAEVPGGHAYTRTLYTDAGGRVVLEMWTIHGAGHAWSGGDPAGSYTDPYGPDAAQAMLRFFLEHRR